MTVALVTDSNAQLSAQLVALHNVSVVAIPITINGNTYREGVDLDADGFYALIGDLGAVQPMITTSQPSPGDFAAVYQRCADEGASEIVSIHVAQALSGSLNSARLGAELVEIPVSLVDSDTASFGVGACVCRVAEQLSKGASVDASLADMERFARGLWSVTALGAPSLLSASGRAEALELDNGAGVDVFRTGPNGAFAVVGKARSVEQACDLMSGTMQLGGAPIRVALGVADITARHYVAGLEHRLRERDDVVEIAHYRIGPSVAAFTGAGTAGGFWYPAG